MITPAGGRRVAVFLLASAAALTTVTVSGAPASAAGTLDGVWRTDGYGTVVSVED